MQDERLNLEASVELWLPELRDRKVLRAPDASLDDVFPASGPITVRHLLTNTSFAGRDGHRTTASQEPLALGADDWLAALADLPLMFLPSEGWRYHHSYGLLGILLTRLAGRPLDEHLRQEVLDPLGMCDTGHSVPVEQAHRLPAAYRHDGSGRFTEVEPAGRGLSAAPPPFDLSHGELLSTAADYAAFARMLAREERHEEDVFLRPGLDMLRTGHIRDRVKRPDSFFPGCWDCMGWSMGVAVQTAGQHRGRYGWSDGLGTDMYVDPDGSFRIMLTQVETPRLWDSSWTSPDTRALHRPRPPCGDPRGDRREIRIVEEAAREEERQRAVRPAESELPADARDPGDRRPAEMGAGGRAGKPDSVLVDGDSHRCADRERTHDAATAHDACDHDEHEEQHAQRTDDAEQ